MRFESDDSLCKESETEDREAVRNEHLVEPLGILHGSWHAKSSKQVRRWFKRHDTIAGLVAVVALLAIVFASGRLHTRLSHPAGDKSLPTVVILPFDSLSNDPAQGFLAEGMTEQLITELGKCQGLRIVSRGSVMKYDGKHLSLEVIAKELQADNVFEGSIT